MGGGAPGAVRRRAARHRRQCARYDRPGARRRRAGRLAPRRHVGRACHRPDRDLLVRLLQPLSTRTWRPSRCSPSCSSSSRPDCSAVPKWRRFDALGRARQIVRPAASGGHRRRFDRRRHRLPSVLPSARCAHRRYGHGPHAQAPPDASCHRRRHRGGRQALPQPVRVARRLSAHHPLRQALHPRALRPARSRRARLGRRNSGADAHRREHRGGAGLCAHSRSRARLSFHRRHAPRHRLFLPRPPLRPHLHRRRHPVRDPLPLCSYLLDKAFHLGLRSAICSTCRSSSSPT